MRYYSEYTIFIINAQYCYMMFLFSFFQRLVSQATYNCKAPLSSLRKGRYINA